MSCIDRWCELFLIAACAVWVGYESEITYNFIRNHYRTFCAFSRYDLILGPVAPTTAPRLGESLSDPLKMYLGDIYTISVNLAGLPGISVPCGKDAKGLPIGLQLIADSFQEKKLIQAAYTYEKRKENLR